MSSIIDAALEYARRGWAVVPVHTPTSGGCSCRKGAGCGHCGKHPRTRYGVTAASRSEATVRDWWRRWPDANVGIATGGVSGILALDVDPRHGGDDSLERLEREHGALPATVESLTGGGGRHLIFAQASARVRNTAGALGPGLDVRGDGGLIVCPPSLHASGRSYHWELSAFPGEVPLASLPSWLLALVTERTENTESTERTERSEDTETTEAMAGVSTRGPFLACSSLDDAIRITLPAGGGKRNRCIFAFARVLKSMPQFAAAGADDLREVVRRWHREAEPVIGTKPFDDTWADFLYAWPRIRCPWGTGAMADALARADAAADPPECARYEAVETRRLIRLCRELQGAAGDDPFFLGCRTAGLLVGMDPRTAARRLAMLKADGVLAERQEATTTKATRYQYLGGREAPPTI